MKAKIIETGEVLNVAEYDGRNGTVILWFPNGETALYEEKDVEFIVDSKTSIDWEQRRYEIAKEAMAAFISSPCYQFCEGNNYYETQISAPKFVARDAVEYADSLIEELKGGKNENN